MKDETKKIKGYKGFDKNLKCRDFQFELEKDFEENVTPSPCEKGFHFCLNPFDVWKYYGVATSRFAEVEVLGEHKNHNEDSKIVTNRIHIGLEVNLKQFINAGFKFIWDKIDWSSPKNASGDNGQAAASGDNGQAAASGYKGQAAASGDNAVSISTGIEGIAKAKKGNWIVLAEYVYQNYKYLLKDVQSIFVDGIIIKENTFYQLIKGEFTEVND